MSFGVKRSVVVAVTGLLWLTGCETTSLKAPEFLSWKTDAPANDTAGATDTTGSIGAPPSPHAIGELGPSAEPVPPATPSKPNDDLSLGRMNFRQGNYGLAERYFRRAVETGPRDAEAWLGLAASYDRLKRFDLADRAYRQLYAMLGRSPEILNNQGYSYMLRGDYARAREKLAAALRRDPGNTFVLNNVRLLEQAGGEAKAVEH
jgi:tetratricopeptide (TPR) repeat protein